MPLTPRELGIMKPLGGGDPIPLKKDELIVGRRPTCEIRLDYDNVSGKHCLLRFVQGTWHVRDLGSTNGTTVNGQRISSEHGLMPDDELGIAGHYFTIDYDPIAPSSIMDANHILEEEIGETVHRHRSLMELAGLETDTGRRPGSRPTRPPERIPRPSAAEAEFPDALPPAFDAPAPPPKPRPKTLDEPDDDSFFKLIEEDVAKE